MQTLFLYAAPAANNFLVCLRLPAKTLFYTCTQFFFSIFSFSNHFFSINFPSLPRQSKNNGSSLRTIKHTTGDLSTYLSLFIFCRTNMTKITSKAILCSTRSMQSSWQLSCWFKWILRTIYQHQCMSQTSKLLCWFLSTTPLPSGGMGLLNKVLYGGGGALPRGPHPLPFYILLWRERFALPGGASPYAQLSELRSGSQHFPWCQRRFMRGFRFRPSAEDLSASS